MKKCLLLLTLLILGLMPGAARPGLLGAGGPAFWVISLLSQARPARLWPKKQGFR